MTSSSEPATAQRSAAAGAEPGEAAALLERIAEIRPLLSQGAVEGERERRVPEASIRALTEAGVFKTSVLRRYGGYDLGHRAAMEVGRAVALADGGTAWVVSLLNSGNWYMRRYPESVQDEVFGADPDARVSVLIQATGQARRVPGGWRLTGSWGYNSGAWHATWAIIAAQLTDEDGAPIGEGQLLVPASDYRVQDVWRVAGMRASGSNLCVVEDVFVPADRVLSVEPTAPDAPPYRAVSVPLALLGPQLGLGRAVLDAVLEQAADRPIAYTTHQRHADSVAFQIDIARATSELDTAELFAARAADDMDSLARLGRPLDLVTRSRVRADIGWAVDHVSAAIERLLSAHGSAAFAEANPIQRFWRDQAIVARHGYVAPQLAYEIYGKALLGVPNDVAPLL
jgi:alkylation response protein AidB-like acyl-CoA dehydrogenase